METLPLTEAKARLNELVDEAVRTHERVTISRHGRPAVVMLAVDDYEALQETLFWLSQPGIMEDIAAGREEVKSGGGLDEVAIRRRFGVGRPSEAS